MVRLILLNYISQIPLLADFLMDSVSERHYRKIGMRKERGNFNIWPLQCQMGSGAAAVPIIQLLRTSVVSFPKIPAEINQMHSRTPSLMLL